MAHCIGSWGASAYDGPLYRELSHICLRWPIVSGAGPYLLTMAHCIGSWAVSAYGEPGSRCAAVSSKILNVSLPPRRPLLELAAELLHPLAVDPEIAAA